MRIESLSACAAVALTLSLSACGGDDDSAMTSSRGTGSQGDGMGGTGGTGDGSETLCEKYGGAEVVGRVVRENVIGEIAEDCRINAFFTTLSEDAFVRVEDCLSIQVQELFACEGVTYEGALASNGLPCRSMSEAHAGLDISSADFAALIDDVVAGLSRAGVEASDIEAAAPALLAMEEDIVEQPEEDMVTRQKCSMGGQGGEAAR